MGVPKITQLMGVPKITPKITQNHTLSGPKKWPGWCGIADRDHVEYAFNRLLVFEDGRGARMGVGLSMIVRAILGLLFVVIGVGSLCAEEARESRTGAFELTGSAIEILGADGAESFSSLVQPDEPIEWEVVVPENYDPARPAGILVYISPSEFGRIPGRWAKFLKSHNLIWVAANRSGNRVPVPRRIGYAILAPAMLDLSYEIDKSRIYLSGFSGGARVSGMVASMYPTLFHGAIYMGGAEPWAEEAPPQQIAAMQANRYAFIVGSKDENRWVALSVQKQYEEAGIEKTWLKIIQRGGHELPKTQIMISALDFLDGRTD